MKESSERPRPDVWEAHSADVESLIKAVEEGGLPYSLAMGELLRSLYSLPQTLSEQQKGADDPPG
jgi:hypothetical protein